MDEEFAFRDANGDMIIFATWYDGPKLAGSIETENLVVLGLNSLSALIAHQEALEKEVAILREELKDCQQKLRGC